MRKSYVLLLFRIAASLCPGTAGPALAVCLASMRLWGASSELTFGEDIGPAYDASSKRTLATTKEGPIDEQDLLLWSLATGKPNPGMYARLLAEKNPQSKAALAQELKKRIADCAYALAIAPGGGGGAQTPFEELFARSMLYPVQAFVWKQRVVLPDLKIGPGDLRNYYANHLKEFVAPRKADVRYIFRRVLPGATEADRLETERGLLMLRQMLEKRPEGFENAAREFSEAPSAKDGGRIPTFEEGDFFPAFEGSVFNLEQPGELTQIVRGPEGLYLIQLIDSSPRDIVPFEKAQEEIKSRLMTDMAKAHFTYEIQRLRSHAYVESRFPYWNSLPDSSRILRVGDFEIAKGDFWRVWPSVIGPDGSLNGAELNKRSGELIEYELIRQDLERRNLTDDPLLRRGRDLADTLVAARRVEQKRIDEQIQQVGSADSLASLPAMELTGAEPRVRLFRISARIREPRQWDVETLAAIRQRLPFILQEYFDQAQSQPPPEASSAERAGEVPGVVRGVKSLPSQEYEYTWTDMGYVDLKTLPEVESLVRGVPVGRFSSVEQAGDAATGYYVGAEKALSPEEEEILALQRGQISGQERRAQIADAYRTVILQSLRLTYAF